MKSIEYDKNKNAVLIKERGVSFDEIIKIIDKDGLIGVIEHHNKNKYPGQKIFLVQKNHHTKQKI